MNTLDIQKELERLGNAADALFARRFFKTGHGEYGEGDLFRGLRLPVIRKLAKKHRDIPACVVVGLLSSPYHEDRLLALFILVGKYKQGGDTERKEIYEIYLANVGQVNNWDLVDGSAEHIVGAYLHGRSKALLFRMARSKNLWERRIAVMATFHYIKRGEFEETLRIAAMLLKDREDLIHKAAGWMLREVGKRSPGAEEEFLKRHYREMPRTMLRYAIEKFPEERRQAYLKGKM